MSEALEVREQPPAAELAADLAPANLFHTDDPAEVVAKAGVVAAALASVIEKQNLSKRIGQKDHVLVEGWTLLGSMLGVFPVLESADEVEGGWRATVAAQTLSGAVVGRATALCLRSESRWKSADDYAVLSMAQTRATSKALRAPLGFIVQLAGFNATPAEEMDGVSTAGDTSSREEQDPEQAETFYSLFNSLKELAPLTKWEQEAVDWCKEKGFRAQQIPTGLSKAEMDALIAEFTRRLEYQQDSANEVPI